ncbi:MAG: AAA family ATPase [Pirellulales bacterium]
MTKTKRCHRLKSLSVIGGFLDGLSIEFADGLNCLIGHRGTGKTTVLEFIRYALDEFPRDEAGQACRKRVEALVRGNLGDGRIRLAVETRDGLEYVVDRTASGEPMVLTADEQPTDVRINSAGIFSADIFSQNEVENIADCPQSQLELIDRFAASQITDLNRQIAALRGKLEANANAIVPARQQIDGLAEELSTREAVAAKIKALAEAQGDPMTDEVNIAHRHRALRGREEQAVQETLAQAGQYSQWLRGGIGQFALKAASAFDDAILTGPNGELMSSILASIEQVSGELDRLFEQAADAVETQAERVGEIAGELHHTHQQQELAFRDLIAKHDQAQGVATERSDLEKKHNDLLAKERKRTELQQQLKTLYQERADLTEHLRELWNRRFKQRQEVAQWINDGATSPIRVQIDQCGDTSDYLSALAAWMKGTVGQYNVAARKIAQYVPPSELARLVAEGRADELQAQAELGDSQVPKVIEALGRLEVQLQLDTIELADMPRIELLDGEEWKNSLQLSTGQKCTTILPILLLESDNPLLVDQPEDNLDNRYIYDTVVQAIHRVKQQRQIILITHNPNIPVLGEASAVYVLTSDGERSRLANCGCVDTCKSEIINLLEGGKEAFVRRKERYDY